MPGPCRRHDTWLEPASNDETHRVRCCCGWVSRPLDYADARRLESDHRELADALARGEL